MSAGRRGRFAVGAVVALVLLALFFRGIEWRALAAAFRTAHRGYLVGVLVATLVTYLARAWRWGNLLEPLARVPFPRLFSITVVGFMAGLVIPRAGEVVRPYLVARRYGIRVSAAFASIILERLVDLLTVLLLLVLYLWVLPVPAAQAWGPAVGSSVRLGGAAIGVVALLILGALVAFHVRADRAMAIVDRLLSRLPKRLALPLGHMLRSFGEGLAVLQAPAGHLFAICVQSLLVWLSIGLSIYWTNQAFGVKLPFHSSFLIISFLTVGVAVPTPGMVGGFHEAYLLALTQAYGVDRETAAAAGIAAHACANLPVLALGLLLLPGEGLTVRKVSEMIDR